MKFFGCVGLIVITIIGTIFSGFVLSIMWDWFVVPTFDVGSLSIPVAIGLAMIVNYLTYHGTTRESKANDETEVLVEFLVLSIGKPALYLLMGWIVTLFM